MDEEELVEAFGRGGGVEAFGGGVDGDGGDAIGFRAECSAMIRAWGVEGLQIGAVLEVVGSADLEVGDTADSEVCATGSGHG